MSKKTYALSILLGLHDSASAGLTRLGGKLDSLSSKMGKIGAKAKRVGKSLTTNLTLPILGIGAAGVKAFTGFEESMARVGTLVDTTTESVGDMGDSVLAMAQRVPVALDDLTSGLYDVRSAGIASADAMRVLEGSARLGVTGLGTAKEATDLVTSAINGFGLEGESVTKIYDTVFRTVKGGKTTIAELAQGFGDVAATVANSGTEVDEYFASISALTTTGVKAATAHKQMRGVIVALTKDTKETRQVFKALGEKDLKGLIKSSGGLVPALGRISEELGGNEAKILKLVGRSEALGAILSLTTKTGDSFTETLAGMRDGTSLVDAKFQEMNKTAAADWQRTKNSMRAAAITLGRTLAPTITKITKKITNLAKWFSNLDSDTKSTIVTIAGVAAAVGPVVYVLGTAATAIKGITIATKLFSRALLMNPIGLLVGGLLAISQINGDGIVTLFSDAIEFWTKQFKDFFAWLNGLFDNLSESFDRMLGITTPEHLKGGLSGALQHAKNVKNGRFLSDSGPTISALSPRSSGAFENALRPQAPAAQGGSAQVVVKFENAPAGTRVSQKSSGVDLSTSTGYQMGGY